MTHSMQLTPSPFQMIKEGTKTIELRLVDEKRRKIQISFSSVCFGLQRTSIVLRYSSLKFVVLHCTTFRKILEGAGGFGVTFGRFGGELFSGSLTVPTAMPVADFHRQVITRAGHTRERG